MVFAVHSSRSLTPANYRKEKELLKRVAATLNIAPGRSRIALILYSNFATAAVTLDEEKTLASFDNLVDGLPHERGVTRIDRALKLARSIFRGVITRRGVPKIFILLTDGKQTLAQNALTLDEAARPLHEADVKIFVVGMGSNVDVGELQAVALDKEDVFLAPFDNLVSLSGPLSKTMCETASKYTLQIRTGFSQLCHIILVRMASGESSFSLSPACV